MTKSKSPNLIFRGIDAIMCNLCKNRINGI